MLAPNHFYNREHGFAVAGLFAASAVLWWLVCLPRVLYERCCGSLVSALVFGVGVSGLVV